MTITITKDSRAKGLTATAKASPRSLPNSGSKKKVVVGVRNDRNGVKVFVADAVKTRGAIVSLTDFSTVYLSPPDERVQWIRRGVKAAEVKDLVALMNVSQSLFFKQLKLSRATIDRKAAKGEDLSAEDSERVVGMSKLIGQVQTMVNESGSPEGFNAAHWLAQWMEQPLSALGGERPADYMDTIEGQSLVSNLLAKMQSGAYA